VVVVGAAARDITRDDTRGWRLGGGVTYGALTVARLGLRTGALVGVDPEGARAAELDFLRDARADVRLVRLERGPIFENRETAHGRIQSCESRSDHIPVGALPAEWRRAGAWILAPVADEMTDEWADVPPPGALVALGWQGILRDLVPGERTRRRPPRASRLVERADVIGVSHHDVESDIHLGDLLALLRPGATLVLTQGAAGGHVIRREAAGRTRHRHYPAIPPDGTDDPTGAGDVFLAALLAAWITPELAGLSRRGADLRIAAAAASLVVEKPGLTGVPDLAGVVRRVARSLGGPGRVSGVAPP
jgi:sugar/nucleoside kinase (ribokinase family)